MKLLRPLAGYALHGHKTNDYIHRELRITGVLDKVDEYRRNWLSHLQRMPQNRIPLKSYRYRPQGRRTIGRPKKRWREQLWHGRRNGSKGAILDVYDDDDDDDVVIYLTKGHGDHPAFYSVGIWGVFEVWSVNIKFPVEATVSVFRVPTVFTSHCATLKLFSKMNCAVSYGWQQEQLTGNNMSLFQRR